MNPVLSAILTSLGLEAEARLLQPARAGGSEVHELRAGEGRWVLRIPSDEQAGDDLKREARIVAGLRPRVSLEIPDTDYREAAGAVPAHAIHSLVEGEPLTSEMLSGMPPAEQEELIAALVTFAEGVHSVPLDIASAWCGIAPEALGAPSFLLASGKPVWFSRELVEGAAGLRAYPRDRWLRAQAREISAAFDELRVERRRLRFVHGDLHGYNLAMRPAGRSWRLAGVFDFGCAGIQDFHADLFRLYFLGRDFGDRAAAAYAGRPGRGGEPDLARLATYYRAFLLYLLIEKARDEDEEEVALYLRLMREFG